MRGYSIAVVAACPFPYPRGTPIRILRMAESLTAAGHRVEVITYHLGQHIADLSFPVHRSPRVPTYHKLGPGPTYQKLLVMDPLLAAKVFSVVRSGNFDIIHAHHFEGLMASLPAARLMRIPVVFDVHTLLSSELPHYNLGLPPAWMRRVGDLFDRTLPQRADHIVAVTQAIRRMIQALGVPASRITTVYTGAEVEHFQGAHPMDPEAVRKTMIYTGTLEDYQRIDLMLQALRRVVDQRPDARLRIVSDSPLTPYEGLIRRLGLQPYLDVVRAEYFELPQNLHSAMIALSPRVVCDGLPIKVLNYMATGRAIVAFDGSAEVVEHERTGLVIPNLDVKAFASAILSLLDDPQHAEELGRNARAHVEEFFVWKSAVRLLENVYGAVLESRPT